MGSLDLLSPDQFSLQIIDTFQNIKGYDYYPSLDWLWTKVFTYLDYYSLMICAQCSNKWYYLSSHNVLWESIYESIASKYYYVDETHLGYSTQFYKTFVLNHIRKFIGQVSNVNQKIPLYILPKTFRQKSIFRTYVILIHKIRNNASRILNYVIHRDFVESCVECVFNNIIPTNVNIYDSIKSNSINVFGYFLRYHYHKKLLSEYYVREIIKRIFNTNSQYLAHFLYSTKNVLKTTDIRITYNSLHLKKLILDGNIAGVEYLIQNEKIMIDTNFMSHLIIKCDQNISKILSETFNYELSFVKSIIENRCVNPEMIDCYFRNLPKQDLINNFLMAEFVDGKLFNSYMNIMFKHAIPITSLHLLNYLNYLQFKEIKLPTEIAHLCYQNRMDKLILLMDLIGIISLYKRYFLPLFIQKYHVDSKIELIEKMILSGLTMQLHDIMIIINHMLEKIGQFIEYQDKVLISDNLYHLAYVIKYIVFRFEIPIMQYNDLIIGLFNYRYQYLSSVLIIRDCLVQLFIIE